jgi:hypothetical protein
MKRVKTLQKTICISGVRRDNSGMKYIPLSLLAFLVFITGCVTGHHKVTGLLHEPLAPEAVMIYPAMPANAEVVGLLSTTSFGGLTLKDASADAILELKTEAGRMGANGVVLSPPDDQSGEGVKMHAKAIFVSR